MANTSNAFSVLKPGYDVGLGGKKKNRRQKKKTNQAEAGISEPTPSHSTMEEADETALAPLTCSDLEAQVKGCKSSEERLGLLNTWRSNMTSQRAYLGSDGQPTSFRTVLLNSQALEVVTEKIMADPGWCETTEEALGGCMEETFKFTDTNLIVKFLAATRNVVSLLSSRGDTIFEAGQRAIGELVVSLKKNESAMESAESRKWNTPGGAQSAKQRASHRQNEAKADRKPSKGESRCDYELSNALDDLKTKLSDLDEIREEARITDSVLQSITQGSIRSISDLKALLSMVCEPVNDGFNDVSKKRNKKTGKNKEANHGGALATAMQPYDSEAAELTEQEQRLSGEIAGLETRLTSLKSQLIAIKEAQAQLQQRKTSIANSSIPLQRVPLISSKDQRDVVSTMEEVLSELEGNPAMNNVDKEAAAHRYLEATQKVMECISNKQDEIFKSVNFLKEAILRKHEHEEQLMTMAMCTSRMELMTTNKNQKENLERQMQEALQQALANLRKSEKALNDTKVRKDFVGSSFEDQLNNSFASIRAAHQKIIAESTIKKKEIQPSPVATPNVKKRFDASKIVKQAEMEVAQEMNRGRRGGQNNHPHPQHKNMQDLQGSNCIVGFTPEPELSPQVKIPNVEDEMVPAPVADRMDPHFSPSAIGNGSHSQAVGMAATQVSPIAPQPIRMSGARSPLLGNGQTMPQAIGSSPVDIPHMYSGAPRGWKKISPKDGDADDTSSDPTPAEALQFTKPQK